MLSLLLPLRCAACSRPGPTLCGPCEQRLVRLAPPWCERCGAPGAWPVQRCAECAGRRLSFASARSAVVYEETARRVVGAWKEQGRRDVARAAASLVAQAVGAPVVDALTYVPADRERTRRRGHSAAAMLAAELSERWGLPVLELCVRARPVERQRGLDLAARRRNVRGAFASSGVGPPARVCLVDDVYTTGATAHACASVVRRAGARRVEVVTLARTVRY